MNPRRPLIALAALASASAVTSGCGVDTAKDGRRAEANTTPAPATRTNPSGTTARRGPAPLPNRPAGTVAIDSQPDRLSDRVVADFQRSSDTNVAVRRVGDDDSYADLCAGRVDVVQTSTSPSTADYRACSDRGMRILDPVQLGSDAVVLATKNEADVGGDCITVEQARDIFRNGSPYVNWSELGFYDLPIGTAGREDGSQGFELFGTEVLGLANATLTDVRSEYRVQGTDAGVREQVTNEARVAAALRRVDEQAKELRIASRQARVNYVNAALKQASVRIRAEVKRINDKNRRLKVNVDAARLKRDNARFAKAVNDQAAFRAGYTFDARINAQIGALRTKALRAIDRPGVIGAFPFAYYELFEDKLRPMEIDFGTAETSTGQPVRFGDLSAADRRRLAPAIRARRGAGGTASSRTRAAGRSGTSGSTGTTDVADIDPQTPIPSVDGLPTKDASGRTIFRGPNCVFPSQTTVTNGAYPLTRRVLYVTTDRALKRKEVRELLTFSLKNANRLATELRLVPITEGQQLRGENTVAGRPAAATGTTGTTGATGRAGTSGASGASAASGTSGTDGQTQATPGTGIPGVSSGRTG